jgi:hypothetical protein
MRAIAWLLRIFCYLFQTILSLALLGVGLVAVRSDVTDMKIEMMPWQGVELNHWLIGLGVAGLVSVILAVTGKLRLLLPLWSFLVLAMLVRGVFFASGVTFEGQDDFHNWLWLTGGALAALIGSFTLFGRRQY